MIKSIVTSALIGLSLCSNAAIAEQPVEIEILRGSHGPIPDQMWAKMQDLSWHSDMPCPTREELSLLTVPYNGFDGETKEGKLIVAVSVADDMLDIMADLKAAGFQFRLMRPVHEFLGEDLRSMTANNTSAFNCRFIGGTKRLSEHARGLAIDINPVQNPYVRGDYTSPPNGRAYDTRKERANTTDPGLILADGAVVEAFKSRGWGWGGDWSSSKDYQHFSKSGN